MQSDADLMVAFREGDAAAFEKLVLRHQVALFNFFLRLVGQRETAEDMTQEVFLRLCRRAEAYRPTAKFTTYLYRIARNCWIDRCRRRARRGTESSLDQVDETGGAWVENLPADGPDPADRLARADRVRAAEAALAALPEEQRVVFVLSEVQGMKYAEIAETLEIPLGTVKSRMHTAVRRLRATLEEHGAA